MPKMSEIRAQFPMYDDVADDQLVIALHRKHYADIPFAKFNSAIERDTERDRLRREVTDNMTTGEKFAAGIGKSAVDLGRAAKRVGNMVGIGDYDAAAAAAAADLDAPLMNTGAGLVGNVAGDVALTAIPGYRAAQGLTRAMQAGNAAVRAAAPYAAAATVGAATGAATSPEDMSTGATIGAVAGPAGELVGRVAPAVWQGAKAVVEPMTGPGRERVLKRTLERFATDPDKARNLAATYTSAVPGVRPTLAEVTLDPGLAALERQFPQHLAEQYSGNNAARVASLRSLGASPEEIAAMEANRSGAAEALYGQAFTSDAMRRGLAAEAVDAAKPFAGAAGIPVGQDLATPGLRQLQSRPVFRAAVNRAKELAANLGDEVGDPLTSAKGLHYIKLALDDGFANPSSPLAAYGQRALTDTRNRLVTELEQLAPLYGNARQTFQQMSQPINRAQVGNEVLKRSTSAAENASGEVALRSEALSRVLRGGDKLAQSVTGFDKATLRDVMGAEGMVMLQALRKDAARSVAAQNVGRGVGSPTAANLAAQNLLDRVAGPLGIPKTFLNSQIANIMAGALGLPVRLTQDQTEQLLVRALSDPKLAAKLMSTPDPQTWLEVLRPYAAQMFIQAGQAR